MIRILASNANQQMQASHASGPFEIGRGGQRDVPRLVLNDPCVSSDHARLEELPNGLVRVQNLSRKVPIRIADGQVIETGQHAELTLPVRLTLGDTLVEILKVAEDDRDELRSIRRSGFSIRQTRTLNDLGNSPSPETLAEWFEMLLSVQRAATGSEQFHIQTARAVVELVGLDLGLVLLRNKQDWTVAACWARDTLDTPEFSRSVLGCMLDQRQTMYKTHDSLIALESLEGIEAVVASPVFDANDQIVAAVYGTRNRAVESRATITSLEAQVVQLLAAAFGAGLARQHEEAEAARARVQFEQFFSPELAEQLERDPKLLEGRERDVTIMFSDIRGFSKIAEQLNPADTCRLICDVMERLTTRIREFGGVVVDYIGDGLLAMWNAPNDVPYHASLACRAALAMRAELPAINQDWQSRLSAPLEIGVGLNTGPALVGNTGSRYKFKYGPLGHTVNLASRIEGATKDLGVPILITSSTFEQLSFPFAVRRVCRVRVVGPREPVQLYELHAEKTTPEWTTRCDIYESALSMFESGRWAESLQALQPLLAVEHNSSTRLDFPSLMLLSRTVEHLKSPPIEFDPVLDLKSK